MIIFRKASTQIVLKCALLPVFHFVFFLFIKPLEETAQEFQDSAINLETFEGYYQFEKETDRYLKITGTGQKLLLTQLWDYKDLVFSQTSDLTFKNSINPTFTIEFKKDSTGTITQLLAFERDLWIKVNSYGNYILHTQECRNRFY